MRNGLTNHRSKTRWMFFVLTLCASLVFGLAFPTPAAAMDLAGSRGDNYPDVIPLPNGWQPEGIAIGPGHTFYAGSRVDGAIYRGDLRTGEGEVFIEGQEGRVATGLKYDQRRDLLVVSGASTGQGIIYNGLTGEELQVYQFTAPNTTQAPTFINDVVVTKDAAYFTNSNRAELYRVDLSDCGELTTKFDVIPLSGEWEQVAGFNANGIAADKKGDRLIVVNTTTGNLFVVDPETGEAEKIDLGGATVTNGDGLLVDGDTLYVVRNTSNLIAVVQLNEDWSAGEVVDEITNPNFDVPTTIAKYHDALYAVNARFTTEATPETTYNVVRVELDK